MSGLLAKTVHQSPVVPSHRPGSATGSRPSKSHSYIVVTMGAVASPLGTWRSRGMWVMARWLAGRIYEIDGSDGCGLARDLGLGDEVGIDGADGGVGDVAGLERPQPAGELEQDAVGILEVDAADVDARVHGVADAELGVVVIGDLGAVDPRGDQTIPVLLYLLGRHVEGDVVHGADRAREVALIRTGCGGADARHPIRGIREPEEGQRVAATA